jgi:hypothetical protein
VIVVFVRQISSSELAGAAFGWLAQSVLQVTRCNGAPSVPFNNGVGKWLVLYPLHRLLVRCACLNFLQDIPYE